MTKLGINWKRWWQNQLWYAVVDPDVKYKVGDWIKKVGRRFESERGHPIGR